MFTQITLQTEIKKGDWVREKTTGELCRIGNLIDGKFELKPNGRSTMLRDGIVFVADQDTLSKKYEIKSGD